MFSQREILQIFEIEGQILQFCGPIFFSNSSELKPLNVCQNATFGLVETSQRKLLVTCYHVWEDFLKLRQNNSDAKTAVLLGGNYPIELKVREGWESGAARDNIPPRRVFSQPVKSEIWKTGFIQRFLKACHTQCHNFRRRNVAASNV